MVFVGFSVVDTDSCVIGGPNAGNSTSFDVEDVAEFGKTGFKFFAFVDSDDGFRANGFILHIRWWIKNRGL